MKKLGVVTSAAFVAAVLLGCAVAKTSASDARIVVRFAFDPGNVSRSYEWNRAPVSIQGPGVNLDTQMEGYSPVIYQRASEPPAPTCSNIQIVCPPDGLPPVSPPPPAPHEYEWIVPVGDDVETRRYELRAGLCSIRLTLVTGKSQIWVELEPEAGPADWCSVRSHPSPETLRSLNTGGFETAKTDVPVVITYHFVYPIFR